MSKLFVTLFINDKICHYGIDELLQNSFNGYVNKDFAFSNTDIYFPIKIHKDGYFIQSSVSTVKIFYNNAFLGEDRKLSHGDYIMFTKDKFTYAALIIDEARIFIGHSIYSLNDNNVFIGRAEESNIILSLNTYISRKCAVIRKDGRGRYFIEDLSGKTGVYVNGRLTTSKELSNGDDIYIMGTTILYHDKKIVLSSAIKTNGLTILQEVNVLSANESVPDNSYVRTPRIFKSRESGKIVIDAVPAAQKSKEIPFILSAGPSITMSLAMLASVGVTISNALNGGGIASMVTSSVMAVSMLAGALLWPLLLRKYNKKQEAEREKHRQDKYTQYLVEKEKEIKQKYDRNIRILNEFELPSPKALSSFIVERQRRLWERSIKDDDFLLVRLGLGEMDFNMEIQAPVKGFVLEDDFLVDKAIALQEKYRVMKNVPISISLMQKKVVGVVGDIFGVLKAMVTNVIALHSSEEVKIVLVYNSTDIDKMRWFNDLPHVWSSDKKQRFVATNREEAKILFSNLNEIFSMRVPIENQKNSVNVPVYLVLVLDEDLIEDVPFKKYLLDFENKVGLSTVFFGKRFVNIPKECVAIVQKDVDVCGVYVKNENDNKFIKFVADEISDKDVEKISREINKISIKAELSNAAIPNKVTFLDTYKVGNINSLNIINRWKTNLSEKSLAAPIGVKAGGEIFFLDIHEKSHGCHGLVAGTTGSGKSEFLQTYILSMMINYSPNEVAFVLVDFKGGDMARPFLKSPHLAATISNLSGNTLRRALISIEAERLNRQAIFNQAAEKLGVDKIDINSYQRYFKENKLDIPLPHLIIVIDEFAQLKSQHPEFMAKLTDIAQVGRSIGIHLILATQRPSGVVDPQIWSNSKFKICLKVLDKQDSVDMIGRYEAALIKNPGRAFIQVGYDEIFEQIQSGYSGADYVDRSEYIDEESISVSMVNWPAEDIRIAKKSLSETRSERTQLEEIMAVLAEEGNRQNLFVKQLWLPPLPANLKLEDCTGAVIKFSVENWDIEPIGEVTLGMVDIPEIQEQKSYVFNFIKQGHVAIYGSAGSGKSTLLKTMLFELSLKYSPDLLHTFVLDFDGGSLASLAAMPHCAGYVTDADENEVEDLLNYIQTMISERRKLFSQNHCANYESYNSMVEEKIPMILLVLDNYAEFREKTYSCEDILLNIVSSARSCGIYFVVTGNSKGAIYYKMLDQISEKIVLNMNDHMSYRDILNVSIQIQPEQCKGRGLIVIDKNAIEVQFAVPFDTQNEANRTMKIQDIYSQMRSVSEGAKHDIPTGNVREKQNTQSKKGYRPTVNSMEALEDLTDAFIIGTELRTANSIGFNLSQRSKIFVGNAVNPDVTNTLINNLTALENKRLFVITQSETKNLNSNIMVVSDIDEFVETLCNASEEALKDVVLVIDGFCDFYDLISDEALLMFEKALVKQDKLVIITCDDMARLNDYRDTGIYSYLVRSKDGLIVGGNIEDNLAYALSSNLYSISAEFRKKNLTENQAIVYSEDKLSYVDIEG